MGLGGGSSSMPVTPQPEPEPVVPVPQKDGPQSVDAKRKVAETAKQRDGYSAHLLAGGISDTDMASTDKARMIR